MGSNSARRNSQIGPGEGGVECASRRAIKQAIGAVWANLNNAHLYRYSSTRKWYQAKLTIYHAIERDGPTTGTGSMPPIPTKWNVPDQR